MGAIFGGGEDPGEAGARAAGAFGISAEDQGRQKLAFVGPSVEEEQKIIAEETDRGRLRSRRAEEQNQALIRDLQRQAAGQGPSLAEAQLKSAQERTLAQQLAGAAAQRGGPQAAIQRTLARQQGESGRQLAQQAAEARIREQTAARQQLGNQIQAEQQLADQLTLQFTQLGFNIEEARSRARMELEQLRSRERLARAGAIVGAGNAASAGQAQRSSALTGGLLGAAGSIGASVLSPAAAISDKDAKKNIKKNDDKMKDFLNKLQAVSFDFKDPSEDGATEGKRFGILAQDLEKSEVGKSIVMDGADRKRLDIAQGFGTVLAAQAYLNKRLKELEDKKKKA